MGKFSFTLFLFLTVFFSCAQEREKNSLPNFPERIVSLSPSVTEILFAIGAGDQVVGVTQFCDYPEEALTRTSVGTFQGATVSIEQIHILNPDLVIATESMHARIAAVLDGLGIPSFAVEPHNFSEVYSTIITLGKITGNEEGANKVKAEMEERIARVQERISGRQILGVFWLLWEDPLMTSGRDTFVSDAVTLAGGRNIFDDAKEDWPLISPEQVLIRKPDWILMGTTGTSEPVIGETSFLMRQFWQSVPAVRDGNIASINSDLVHRHGPRLAEGVELIAEILHP